jgi:type II secretory pathway pseudopilin PulG
MNDASETSEKQQSASIRIFRIGAAITVLAVIATAVVITISNSVHKCTHSPTLGTALDLESAAMNFQTEYDNLPDVAARCTTDSPEGIKLLNILLGIEASTARMQNQKGVKFLNVREGKQRKNGLIYSKSGDSVEGLFDSWGNPYTIVLDVKNEGTVHFELGKKTVTLKNRRVAAFSPGPDAEIGTRDDVVTW